MWDARGKAHPSRAVAACTSMVLPLVQPATPTPRPARDLERLAAAARSPVDLAAFVAQVTLDPPASTGDYAKPPHLDEDYVTLSTVHSAKGLEWPTSSDPRSRRRVPVRHGAVHRPGLAEEQRLFYVAVTRARDELSSTRRCACRTIAGPATTVTASPPRAGS